MSFIISYSIESESDSHSVMSDSLQLHGLYSPWNFPSQNTEVDSHSLLQGIFPPRDQTQGANPGLLHCRQILYHLSHQGSPKVKEKVTQLCLTLCDPMDYIVHGIFQARIVEWVAVPFSRTSPQPRYQTHVSSIAGRFFTSWATRKAQEYWIG